MVRGEESLIVGWVIYSRKVSQLQNQHHGQPTRDQTRRQQYQRHPKRRLTFRIEEYSLASDLAASLRRPFSPGNAIWQSAPMLVLSNFDKAVQHEALSGARCRQHAIIVAEARARPRLPRALARTQGTFHSR